MYRSLRKILFDLKNETIVITTALDWSKQQIF